MNSLLLRFPSPGYGLRLLAPALAIFLAASLSIPNRGLYLLPLTGLVAVGLAVIVGLLDWLSLRLLLLYTPISGAATVLLFPNTGAASALKDLFFVAPAYIGFMVMQRKDRRVPVFWAPLLLTVFIALIQSMNPNLPNIFVALVGLKTYFWYIPMLALGYYFASSQRELSRFFRLVSLTAMVPAVVGIVQALLMYSGHRDVALRFYGNAASAMTHDDVNLLVSGTGVHLRRIPSTFPFATQYYIYLAVMLCCSYAWWRGFEHTDKLARRLGPIRLAVTIVVAAMLSGQRGAFLFVPLLVLMILLLHNGGLDRRGFLCAAAAAAGLSLAFLVLSGSSGASPESLVPNAIAIGKSQFISLFGMAGEELLTRQSMAWAPVIYAARQFFPEGRLVFWEESLYIKAYFELGLAGLVTYGLFLAGTVTMVVRSLRSLQNSAFLLIVVATLALVLWTLIYGAKTSLLDLDPLNFYFWFLIGITLRLPSWSLPGRKGAS